MHGDPELKLIEVARIVQHHVLDYAIIHVLGHAPVAVDVLRVVDVLDLVQVALGVLDVATGVLTHAQGVMDVQAVDMVAHIVVPAAMVALAVDRDVHLHVPGVEAVPDVEVDVPIAVLGAEVVLDAEQDVHLDVTRHVFHLA